ncbi:hypothetical protein EBR56_05170 [bacterium]|nr:hypothetical protein [bacterium]
MFVVDTNVLIYAADRDAAEHRACRALVARCRSQSAPWYLTWGIVYEFLRVTTHPAIFRRPFVARDAWSFLEAVFASPGFGMLVETERHLHVARAIYTNDTDLKRFPFIDVLDPSRKLGR